MIFRQLEQKIIDLINDRFTFRVCTLYECPVRGFPAREVTLDNNNICQRDFLWGDLLHIVTLNQVNVRQAQWLDQAVGRQDVIVLLIGIASAIVDNVPGTATPIPPTANLQVFASGTGSPSAPANCTGASFPITVIGKPPFSATSSRPGVILNPNPVTTTPGQLNVSSVPAGGATTITIGDANSPQQLATVTIYCQ